MITMSMQVFIIPIKINIRDYFIITLFAVLYAIYSMLYVIYGPISSFLSVLIFLVMFIYGCKIAAYVTSNLSSLIYDLENSEIQLHDIIEILRKKLNTAYWLKIYTLALLWLLIAGSVLNSIMFLNYTWISVVYNQIINAGYICILLYIFRCTEFNLPIYQNVPLQEIINLPIQYNQQNRRNNANQPIDFTSKTLVLVYMADKSSIFVNLCLIIGCCNK